MPFPYIPAAMAAAGLIGSIFGSKGKQDKGKVKQFPTRTPQQMGVMSQLLGGAQGALPGAFNFLQGLINQSPESQQQFSAPYLRNFREETIPEISTLFAGLGAGSSSGFQQALGQAGAGLQAQLAQLHGNLGLQGIQGLQGMLGYGLQSPFESVFMQGQPSGMQRFGQALAPSFGQGLQGLQDYSQQRQMMKQLPAIIAAMKGGGGGA